MTALDRKSKTDNYSMHRHLIMLDKCDSPCWWTWQTMIEMTREEWKR